MVIFRRLIAGALFLLVLTLGFRAWAAPMALFSFNDLGGGFFQYDLTVFNNGGTEPLSGLLVLNGASVFGLDATSIIGAPQDIGGNPAADWSFLAPLPPFVDVLSYFSLDPAADVPINGSLGGFFFQSAENPINLSNDDFAVVGIGAITASEIPLGNAQFVSEPSSLLLFAITVAGLVGISAFGNTNRGERVRSSRRRDLCRGNAALAGGQWRVTAGRSANASSSANNSAYLSGAIPISWHAAV